MKSITTAMVCLLASNMALGRAIEGSTSLLNNQLIWDNLPVGKTPVSKKDMIQIGRRAMTINAAACHTAPLLSGQLPLTEKTHGLPRGSSVLASSDDAEYSHLRNEVNMGWFIAHSPSTQTLTLTLSSLPTVDDLLEFLSVDALDDKVFVDLSPDYFAHNSTASVPQIYHTFDQAFDVHGKSALYALEQIIAEPPQSDSPVAAFLPKQLRPLVEWFYPSNPPIAHVDIVGHGLGGVVGLLVSLALSKSSPEMPITSTLFSLPRMGNPAFAAWVDDKMDSKFQVYRVVSYADTIPHVPAEHLGVAHPKKGEVWVGADPRTAYACNSAGSSTAICSASVAFSRTSLVDHNGPFGGIWIQDGTECGIGFNVAKTL